MGFLKKKEKADLTQGNITLKLIKLALPIMGTSFVQMAYNLTDMIWIGRIGSNAVAAVGTAGFFIWLSFAFIMMVKVGTEVGVSQAIGRKEETIARSFARNAIQLTLFISILYSLFLILTGPHLIDFFRLGDITAVSGANKYLFIIALGMVFSFQNPVFSGIYNGAGHSLAPFWINSIGLVFNMILDPLLIFGKLGIPALGVEGAAYATVASQTLVTLIFIVLMKTNLSPFSSFRYFIRPKFKHLKAILTFGYPVGVQSALFTTLAILIARIITQWGALPIAVQKVGSQIEALSWMTASGFSSALSAFTGQNYGAKRWDRIFKGYFITLAMASVLGIIATYLLYFQAEFLFGIFIPEKEAIEYGVVYLKILGLSQLFMSIEIVTAGAFNGLGQTLKPAVISILFTGARVPGALILSSTALLGLEGVWWSISMSSVFKGVILVSWFCYYLHKHPEIESKKMIQCFLYRWNIKYFRDKKCIDGRI